MKTWAQHNQEVQISTTHAKHVLQELEVIMKLPQNKLEGCVVLEAMMQAHYSLEMAINEYLRTRHA